MALFLRCWTAWLHFQARIYAMDKKSRLIQGNRGLMHIRQMMIKVLWLKQNCNISMSFTFVKFLVRFHEFLKYGETCFSRHFLQHLDYCVIDSYNITLIGAFAAVAENRSVFVIQLVKIRRSSQFYWKEQNCTRFFAAQFFSFFFFAKNLSCQKAGVSKRRSKLRLKFFPLHRTVIFLNATVNYLARLVQFRSEVWNPSILEHKTIKTTRNQTIFWPGTVT